MKRGFLTQPTKRESQDGMGLLRDRRSTSTGRGWRDGGLNLKQTPPPLSAAPPTSQSSSFHSNQFENPDEEDLPSHLSAVAPAARSARLVPSGVDGTPPLTVLDDADEPDDVSFFTTMSTASQTTAALPQALGAPVGTTNAYHASKVHAVATASPPLADAVMHDGATEAAAAAAAAAASVFPFGSSSSASPLPPHLSENPTAANHPARNDFWGPARSFGPSEYRTYAGASVLETTASLVDPPEADSSSSRSPPAGFSMFSSSPFGAVGTAPVANPVRGDRNAATTTAAFTNPFHSNSSSTAVPTSGIFGNTTTSTTAVTTPLFHQAHLSNRNTTFQASSQPQPSPPPPPRRTVVPPPTNQRGVPTGALYSFLNKAPYRVCVSGEDYFIWDDGGKDNEKRFTCVFVSPLTGELFWAGRYGNTTGSNLCKVLQDPQTRRMVCWYTKKNLAKHGAASRAYDCITFREGKKQDVDYEPIGEEKPYMELHECREIPGSAPEKVQQAIRAAQAKRVHARGMKMDVEEPHETPWGSRPGDRMYNAQM